MIPLRRCGGLSLVLAAAIIFAGRAKCEETYPLPVLPREDRAIEDPVTGAELLFVTTNPARDHNLYFHQRSWLSDDSLLLFTSDRPEGGLMGYVFATGELVRLITPQGGLGAATAAREHNRVFAYRPPDIVELTLAIQASPDPAASPSRVTATERVICTLPQGAALQAGLTESSDGTLLGLDLRWPDGEQGVATASIATGEVRDVCRFSFAGHLQFSRTNPNLMSVAGLQDRLVVIDLSRGGQPYSLHHQAPGEFITHEYWWVNDTLTFCGGYRDKESHLKVIDAHTGQVRIVGAGAWVPWAGDGDDVLNRWNWWHAAGHESGRWIAADNWYGDVVLFDGATTQMHRLTLGHRKYGGGEHPEPGWDRAGKRVVFTSQMLGGVDVCVAAIPETWPPDPAAEGLFITGGVLKSDSPAAGLCSGAGGSRMVGSAGAREMSHAQTTTYPLPVLPAQDRRMKDPITGAELLFVTTGPTEDRGLYFHQKSWLADESMLLFTSDRPQREMMGYLFATGELAHLTTPRGGIHGGTCARFRSSIFAYRGREVLELALTIEPSADPAKAPSRVTATERVIAALPENPIHFVTENADSTLLGCEYRTAQGQNGMLVVEIASGKIRDLGTLNFGGHMQFSRGNPTLFSFAGRPNRLMVRDLNEDVPRCIHEQAQGEHVTHDSWWVDDQIIFAGRYRDKEEHVKVIDPATGIIRIIGAGAWLPWRDDGDDILNRWNWWHTSGDWQGRWVAADNWYGDIVLFAGGTTQMHRLTLGHRTYGGGEDPHVGWDRSGKRVVFTSQMLGGVDVCVAAIPDTWPPDPAAEGLMITGGALGK